MWFVPSQHRYQPSCAGSQHLTKEERALLGPLIIHIMPMPDLNSLPPSTRSPSSPSHPPPPASSSSTSLPQSSSSLTMSLSSPTNNSEAASNRHRQPSSPSPSLSPSRSAATSLQAAATVNAGLHHGSRRAWTFPNFTIVFVLSTDSLLRLFRVPLSTSCNFVKRRSSPVSGPNESTTQRSCNSRARRNAA